MLVHHARVKGDFLMTTVLESYRVTAALLNMRSGPTTTSKILGQIKKDQVVEKLAESSDSQWLQYRRNNLDVWSAKKFLEKIPEEDPTIVYPWMAIADKEYGVVEIPGAKHNPRVLEYLSTVNNISTHWKSRDETAWCSAFVNWCVEKAGYVGTKSAVSTDWLAWGRKVYKPVKGCIAVFSREGGGGHVGFYFDETPALSETYIRVLGGNQEHMETEIGGVNLKHYKKSRLLGYRLPK